VSGGCTRPVFRIPPGTAAEQIGNIRNHASAVLVFGPGASANEDTATLNALQDTACSAIVFAARKSLADFQRLVDDDRLFYLASGELQLIGSYLERLEMCWPRPLNRTDAT
jgi:hypothetical protein